MINIIPSTVAMYKGFSKNSLTFFRLSWLYITLSLVWSILDVTFISPYSGGFINELSISSDMKLFSFKFVGYLNMVVLMFMASIFMVAFYRYILLGEVPKMRAKIFYFRFKRQEFNFFVFSCVLSFLLIASHSIMSWYLFSDIKDLGSLADKDYSILRAKALFYSMIISFIWHLIYARIIVVWPYITRSPSLSIKGFRASMQAIGGMYIKVLIIFTLALFPYLFFKWFVPEFLTEIQGGDLQDLLLSLNNYMVIVLLYVSMGIAAIFASTLYKNGMPKEL